MKVGDTARAQGYFKQKEAEIMAIDENDLVTWVTLQYGKDCDFAKVTVTKDIVEVVGK